MSYIFLKKPYGIVNDEHKVHIYNYKTQKIEKTYLFEEEIPKKFGERLAIEQIIELEKLLEESSGLEKGIISKLIRDGKFVQVIDNVVEEQMHTEIMMYEAEKIGMNYANSNEHNAKYKVYKNLKNNIEDTNIVVVGAGIVGVKLVKELIHYPWKKIYVVQDKSSGRETLYEKLYQNKKTAGDKKTALENFHLNIIVVKDINDVLNDSEGKLHVIYVYEDNDIDKLVAFNQLMVEERVTWSLLAINSNELIIGPTFFPGQMGCVQCGLERSFFENKYNVMTYEANIMVGIFVSDLAKIIGKMPEAIVEDISVTLGRAFCVNRRTLNGESKDLKLDITCSVCGNKNK